MDTNLDIVTLSNLLETVHQAVETRKQTGFVNKSDLDLVDEITQDELIAANTPIEDALLAFKRVVSSANFESLAGILPVLLRLRGKPYTLENHFPMEPVFHCKLPPQIILRNGRQTSKSTTLAAQNLLHAGAIPYFNSLFVTPLFEQARRFSSNYIRPFISESPFYKNLIDAKCEQNVLQRSFLNKSNLFFSYCLRDADRIRGIAADRVTLDEVQDIDKDLIPVIVETMSASNWAILQAAGTPKTTDNTIERLWNRSSMAEWVTKCEACNYYNVAAMANDLIKMIGEETLVCAKCGHALNPRPKTYPNPALRGSGFWLHAWPDRANEFPGYHSPQVIFPMHYANPRKWQLLRQKMNPANTPRVKFVNEVLGEAADSGLGLLNHSDIVEACRVYNKENKYKVALKAISNYADVAIGIDWGGSTAPYGANRAKALLHPEDLQSYTVLAIVGLRSNHKVDVLYLFRFDLSDHLEEAKACLAAWKDVDSNKASTMFCHDYGGAGSVRETLIIQAGLPVNRVVGFQYVAAPQQNTVVKRDTGARSYWSLDKARSLIFLCQAIKCQCVGLPAYDSMKPFVSDFMALVEDKLERPGSADIIRIIRKAGMPDDAVHAVNYAATGLWQRHGYPDLGKTVFNEATLLRLNASANSADEDANSK